MEDKHYLCILTEFIHGGDLQAHIASKERLDEPEARGIFYQLCSAVHYLHTNGITHRDLKPDNVMLANSVVKLTDFGVAKCISDQTVLATLCGTPSYLAPEVLRQSDTCSRYDQMVDIWSLGIILYHMLVGQLPFTGETQAELYHAIRQGEYNRDHTAYQQLSDASRDCLHHLIQVYPWDRPLVNVVMRHRWLRQPLSVSDSWGELVPMPGCTHQQAMSLVASVTLLGRGVSTDLPIVDGRVSKHHCTILHVNGRTLLHDLSTNGIGVNGTKIDGNSLTLLNDGDVIDLLPHSATQHQESLRFTLNLSPAAALSLPKAAKDPVPPCQPTPLRANGLDLSNATPMPARPCLAWKPAAGPVKRPLADRDGCLAPRIAPTLRRKTEITQPNLPAGGHKSDPTCHSQPVCSTMGSIDALFAAQLSPWLVLQSLNANFPHIAISASSERLGRHPSCHPQGRYKAAKISGKHCIIAQQPLETNHQPPPVGPSNTTPAAAWVKDTSSNGTYLNSKRLSPKVWTSLHDGDMLVLLFQDDYYKRYPTSGENSGDQDTDTILSPTEALPYVCIGYRIVHRDHCPQVMAT
ncbi:Checkpoint kinase 2 [Dimargaris verticillata]|uniref:Checkpoint kinase 2 n=1 Tax=Dimargaris verticillata TaxID=2761393 RepID=A0A9W8B2D2_9FUNG|nr:Checkpoint kinase 2 [Dimargaris verticillata]